jgi:hypothetical protein
MFNFIKKQRKALRLCVLVPLIGILTLELLLRLGSSSALFRGLVARRFSSEQAHCRIDWLRVSLFSGVLAEGLHLDLDSPLGRLEFQAREAMYRIRLHKVFSKALSLKNLRFRHAELSLLNEAGHPILRCRQLAFSARLQNPQQLALMLSFRQNGIRVNGAALLDNASELPTLLARRPAGKERDYQKVLALLEKFQAYFEHCEFGENDTRLAFNCSSDLRSWQALELDGDFDLNYGQLGPVMVQKQRGRFKLRQQVFELYDLLWIFENNERLQASGSIDFKSQNVSADFQGRLAPETLLSLAGGGQMPWPAFIHCPLPMSFKGKLSIPGLDLQNFDLQLDSSLRALSIYDSRFQFAKASLRLHEQSLEFNELLLAKDYRGNKTIGGTLKWDFARQLLSGDIQARMNLYELLEEQGWGRQLQALQHFDDLQLEASLLPSEPDWRKWRLKASLREAQAQVFGLRLEDLVLPLSLEDESIYINDASAKLRQNGSQDLLLQGRIDLQDLLASKQLPAEMKLELRKESEGEGEAEEILSTQAGCRLDLQKNSLEIFDGQANLVPELLLQVFREQFERLYASIDEMIAGSRKMSLQYSLPEFDLRQPSSWLLLLQMQARDARFRNLRIHQMQAEAQINARNASFRRIQAQVDQDEELELDLFIDFKAPSLRVANAFVKARPELFDAFIFNEEASRIYALLWQNVRWDQEQPPKISIPELFFWEDPLHGKNWQLKIEAGLQLANAFYKDFPLPEAELSLLLDLPESLLIEPIILKTGHGDIQARMEFSFEGNPHCSFELFESDAPLDSLALLKSIDDDWRDFLELIDIHPQSKVQCQGRFDFSSPMQVQIQGKLLAKELGFRGKLLQNADCTWNYDKDKLFWHVKEAGFYDSRLQNSGYFDFLSRSGESLLKIRGLSLEKAENAFLGEADTERKNSLQGRIDLDGKVAFLQGWADSPLYLEGGGHFKLREADLWQVPLLHNLASLLSLGFLGKGKAASLGSISELEADYTLQGSRVLVNRFATDGTIIALHGDGEYAWDKDKLKFAVKGEALKNVNLLSFMLKPLSWAFDAELRGSIKKPEWKIRSALNRVFDTD